MRIGEDVSIQECRDSGYWVMDYSVAAWKDDARTCLVSLTRSYPLYIREEMGWSVGDPMIAETVVISWEDVWDIYVDHKKEIDSFIGGQFFDYPTPHELLFVASAVSSYCGLE